MNKSRIYKKKRGYKKKELFKYTKIVAFIVLYDQFTCID